MARKMRVQLFDSFEAENNAENVRRASLSPEERMKEFAAIQKRVWGTEWQKKKIEHRVSYEVLNW